jgi:hydroxylamine reductase (hybrid-cluster protein)
VGRKGKIEAAGLIELVAEKRDGGKNTIVYVTEEVNKYLKENGFKMTVSRGSIGRVVRGQEAFTAETRKAIDAAKAMAEVLKDYPATEATEAMLMQLAHLISTDLQNIGSITFDNASDLIEGFTRIANTQARLSGYRTKAVAALEKAKAKIKWELQKAIQSDPELLERLCRIVDDVKVA